MEDAGARLHAVFRATADERIQQMNALAGDACRGDEAARESLRNEAHALRGGAAVSGQPAVRDAAGALEELLGERAPLSPDELAAALARLSASVESAVAAPAGPQTTSVPARSAATATILHVDDDPVSRLLVSEILTERPSVRVVACADGKQALDVLRETRPNLLVLDLHIGAVSGWTIVDELADVPEARGVPVLVVSAETDIDARPVGQEERRIERLRKPFEVAAFLRLVDELCGAEA